MAEIRSLVGTVVAVTGASSGIGAATARSLASQGARVVVGARRVERLEALREEIGPDNVVAVAMDAARPEDNARLVDAARENFGRLDSIVVNAGIGMYGGILDHTDSELAEMIDTNVAGTVWAIRAAVPAMMGDGGDIVVVSSVAGLRGGANEAVYAGTKFAQVGIAAAVDRELREHGIRVTTICPAATATEFAIGRGRTADMPEMQGWMTAEDIAEAIVFTLRQPRRLRTTQWHLWSATEGS